MASQVGAVRVKGLRELTRDFKAIDRAVAKELRRELKQAAEPVRRTAEQLALSEITNMPRSPQWAGMRIGVSVAQGSVYVVPQQRGGRGSARPNLADLLLDRAMDPALERRADEVARDLEDMFDRVANSHGF